MYSTLGTSQGVQRQKSKKVRVSKGPRLVHSFAVYLQTDALQFIPTLRFKEIGVLGTPGTQNHRSPFFQNTTEMKKKESPTKTGTRTNMYVRHLQFSQKNIQISNFLVTLRFFFYPRTFRICAMHSACAEHRARRACRV